MQHRLWRAGIVASLMGAVIIAMPAVRAADAASSSLFDYSKTEFMSGTVDDYQWSEPNAWLWVKSATGRSGFELETVDVLRRLGWNPGVFSAGERVRVSYHPFRDGEPGGLFLAATRADGTKIDREGTPNATPATASATAPGG